MRAGIPGSPEETTGFSTSGRRDFVPSFVKEDFFQACNQETLELLASPIFGTQGSPEKQKGTRPFRGYLSQWGRTQMT